jgi:transposase InsO family protein
MIKMLLILILNILLRPQKDSDLALENLALRQQLAILKRHKKRPQIRSRDRFFWVLLSRFWSNWQEPLIIVKPETVIRWHRKGFKLIWRFKSRRKGPGRPPISSEIRDLVRRMANANPLWGAPRIHGELLKLGIEISERTVSNLMHRRKPKPPSQTWRTFLKNHMMNMVSIDFFTVPTATFRILFVLVILSHRRRQIVHFNVTPSPTAMWTAQQIIEAFPWDTAPKYLLRDRDSIYGAYFRQRVKNMDIKEVITAARSPWQNPFVERLIGSIRRDCLDHAIVLNESHLNRILSSYFDYYHYDRTHYGLGKDTPFERPVQPRPAKGAKVIELPRVGGLHHRYEWKEAA